MSTPPSPDGLDDVLHTVEEDTREPPSRSPAMEIIEEPNAFLLTCDVPAAEREDIRVDVSPHRVVVAVLPRVPDPSARGKGVLGYRDFERAVPLPSEVKPESAEARLNNGVLEVLLPKKVPGGSGVYRIPAQ